MSILTFQGLIPRNRAMRLKITGLTDIQFDLGNLWRHILRCISLKIRYERNIQSGINLSLNQMRKAWHTHLDTLKRAIGYSHQQLKNACRLLTENKIQEAIDQLLASGQPELKVMARLKVVQAGSSSSVAKYSRSMQKENSQSNHGVMTPYGGSRSEQTANGIRQMSQKQTPPLLRPTLPTGSNADLEQIGSGCGINESTRALRARASIYSSPVSLKRAPDFSAPTDIFSEPYEKSVKLKSWQIKSFVERHTNPLGWRKCLRVIRNCFSFAEKKELSRILTAQAKLLKQKREQEN